VVVAIIATFAFLAVDAENADIQTPEAREIYPAPANCQFPRKATTDAVDTLEEALPPMEAAWDEPTMSRDRNDHGDLSPLD
jgi:hypothetical protein